MINITFPDGNVKQFENFFKENFDNKNTKQAIKVLEEIVNKIEFTEEEMFERIQEFIKLEQYDNARFTASKIKDDAKRIDSLRRIEIFENFISHGKYREAGIKFWEYGLIEDAKKQFIISNLEEEIEKASKNVGVKDYKTILQEKLQENGDVKIQYTIIKETGPDHNKMFEAEVRCNNKLLATGQGKSKKSAEMQAAQKALDVIKTAKL